MLHKKYTGIFCSFCDVGKVGRVEHWTQCSLFEITAHENLITRFIGYTMYPLELASTSLQHKVQSNLDGKYLSLCFILLKKIAPGKTLPNP